MCSTIFVFLIFVGVRFSYVLSGNDLEFLVSF